MKKLSIAIVDGGAGLGELREMAEWVLMAGGPNNTYMTRENIIVSGGYIYA